MALDSGKILRLGWIIEQGEHNMPDHFKFIGKDVQGISRVWGSAETKEAAYEQCRKACEEYVARRPDCWPMMIEDRTGQSSSVWQ